MSDKPIPNRRQKVMDAIFGERSTGDDLQKIKAAQPSMKIHYGLQAIRLFLIIVIGAWLLNVERQLPLIGPWLAQSTWSLVLVWGGCLIILAFSGWHYERRKKTLRQ